MLKFRWMQCQQTILHIYQIAQTHNDIVFRNIYGVLYIYV